MTAPFLFVLFFECPESNGLSTIINVFKGYRTKSVDENTEESMAKG